MREFNAPAGRLASHHAAAHWIATARAPVGRDLSSIGSTHDCLLPAQVCFPEVYHEDDFSTPEGIKGRQLIHSGAIEHGLG